jgi:hypothetical protein
MADVSERLTLGVFLPGWEDQYGAAPSWSEIHDMARRAEEAGLDALWLPDHLLLTPRWGTREAWTLLAALAASTSRITIGTLVTCTAFREPALLALMASTLDEVSGGRLILGLGAGYPDRDLSWQAFGYATDHPVGRFEEAVEIIVRLLHGERVTYQGAPAMAHLVAAAQHLWAVQMYGMCWRSRRSTGSTPTVGIQCEVAVMHIDPWPAVHILRIPHGCTLTAPRTAAILTSMTESHLCMPTPKAVRVRLAED